MIRKKIDSFSPFSSCNDCFRIYYIRSNSFVMAKVYVKVYGEYTLSGRDFPTVQSSTMRRLVFSPDNKHSLSVEPLRDGCLCITNDAKVAFGFSISRNRKLIATVKYNDVDSTLLVNTNWRISQKGVENKEIHTSPDLIVSPNMHIDVNVSGVGRIDLKVDDGGVAACVFSNGELLFVRMNGNRVVPRLEGFIQHEANRHLEMMKDGIGKKYLDDWLKNNVPQFQPQIAEID